MAKTKFYKLGKKATTFFDPVTKVNVSNQGATSFTGIPSKKLSAAIGSGHLVEISETEYTEITGIKFEHPKAEAPAKAKKTERG